MVESKLDTQWRDVIAIVVPKEAYDPQKLDTNLKVSEEVVLGNDSWRFSGVKAEPSLTVELMPR